eukprot:GEMP01009081.1.p1 GENE.GEMP01009081.1~~GEMP01009081.1.p1  ORF type:complete len:609 (+),score=138.36 GEMP01009081.1:130-1956(+)
MTTMHSFTQPIRDSGFLQSMASSASSTLSSLLPSRQSNGSSDFFFGNVSGDHNFNFTFRLEGGGFFQTGILVASATARDGPKGIHVPLKCTWFRRVGNALVEIPNISSNMYQISADDIGTNICVSVVAADGEDGYRGTAFGEIGPFELDPSTRRSLDNAVGAGGSRFPVRHFKAESDADATTQDLVIHVMQDDVKVVQPGMTERFNKEVVAFYTADFPKVIIHPLDTVKFRLVMNEEKTFHLAALSRTSRDLVALTIRCFHARKYISTSYVLSQLFAKTPNANGQPDGAAALDLQIMTSRLMQELNRAIRKKERIEKALKKTTEEKSFLDAQLHETITSYTTVIENLQQAVQTNESGGSNHSMMQRLRDAEREASSAKSELEEVRHRWLNAQHARADPFNDGIEEQVAQMRAENQRSTQRLKECDKSNLELRRQLAEMDKIRQEKEGLVLRIRAVDQEKQEIISNYHHMKQECEKLQMRQAASESSSSSAIVDTGRHTQIVEEKNRLARQLEQMCREKERGKNSQEAQVERLMGANAKLLEEKDRIEKEKQRISTLFQETVAQLRAGAPNGGSDPAVQATIQQQQDTIARLEQENGSLKSRIRKLAMT